MTNSVKPHQKAVPATRRAPARPPLLSISRSGWCFAGVHQPWAALPAALVIGGLWLITWFLAAELISTVVQS